MTHFFNFHRIMAAILAIGVSLGVATMARAQSKPHKEKTSGTIHVSKLISATTAYQEWTAEGQATHMGLYKQTGSHKIDLVAGTIYEGQFESVAADGSTASGIFFGTFSINDDGSVNYHVTAVWTEGTGRFVGLSGIADVDAVATGITPESTFRYTTDGVWELP